MPSYQCCFINSRDQVARFENSERHDDASASEWARELLGANPDFSTVELWERGRFVLRESRPARVSA
jgi:hypothetical protein